MLPSLVRVAVPPAELRTTPAEGRPPKFPVGSEPTLLRSACQPPITDPAWTWTVTPPLPLVALIPVVAIGLLSSDQQFPLGGTSILIAVGVGLDTVKQIESQLQQRNYEGFLR